MPSEKESPGFVPTRWSLVLRAQGNGEASQAALEELCAAYWYPLYAWARRTGLSPSDSEDAVQGFFAVLLDRRLFDRADAGRGRLRSFLLTVFRRHLRDDWVKAGAERRGGGHVVSFDAVEAEEWFRNEPADDSSPEEQFDRRWALTVLDRALARVEEMHVRRGKGSEFAALRPFLTRPGGLADYEAAGRPVGLSGGAFKVALHRLRERFREALREEVRETSADESEVDAELAHLVRILGR